MRHTCLVLLGIVCLAACQDERGEGRPETLTVPNPISSSPTTYARPFPASSDAAVPVPGAWVAIHGLPRSPEVVLRAHNAESAIDLFVYILADTPEASLETLPVRWLVSDAAVGVDVRGSVERGNQVTLRGLEDAIDHGGREPHAVVYACVDGRRQARGMGGPPVACSPPVHVAVVPDLAGTWLLTADDGAPTEISVTQDGRRVCGFPPEPCGTITDATLDINDGFDRWQGRIGSDRRIITGQMLSEDDTVYGEWRAERTTR